MENKYILIVKKSCMYLNQGSTLIENILYLLNGQVAILCFKFYKN